MRTEAEVRELERAARASDEREARMDRVAVLYARITAATREFLVALAESDRHGDWAEEGFASCAEWLAWRIGVTRNTANEKVRAARALEALPRTSEAMARGELSFSKVRALTRVATRENESALLELARAGSAANLERVVRGWKRLSREDEAAWERARHRRRCFSVFPDEDGMYVVRGRLTPEVAAVLMRAVEAAGDALFRRSRGNEDRRRPGPVPEHPHRDHPEEEPVEPRQRRADAVGLLAERALAAGFGDVDAPVSGSRAARHQVVLHVEAATLKEEGEPGRSELEDGTRVTAVTARRLACDAGVVEVRHAPDGSILDVGRRRRTVPPALRRAVEARDRGCRFPGCGLHFTDAHHIVHWADGGETSLRNTALLCRRHHRLVHEGGWRICSDSDGDNVVFFTPGGRAIADAPEPPALGDDPVGGLVGRNGPRGIEPTGRDLAPRYRRDGDIPYRMEAAAWEALDPRRPGDEAVAASEGGDRPGADESDDSMAA